MELERVVMKKRTVKLVQDAAWYSEPEMRQDLKWSQCPSCNLRNAADRLLKKRIDGAKDYCLEASRRNTHVRQASRMSFSRNRMS